MKTYDVEDMIDRDLGAIGTPERDAFETDVHEAIQAYHIGEAIKKLRQQQHMTQDQLAERMGVKKAQVSRIERGKNPTINTITRALNALGLKASLNFGDVQIALA